MTYKQSTSITTQQQNLRVHKNSHNITKIQPKIRIIHIYAPEIIKTDVSNFRELVQRLTGKLTSAGTQNNKGKGKSKTNKNVNRALTYEPENILTGHQVRTKPNVNTKLEVMMGSTTTTTTGSSSSPSSCDITQHDDQGYWRPMSISDDHNININNSHNNHNNNNNNNNSSGGGFLTAFSDIDDHFDGSMYTLGVTNHHSGGSHHLHSFGETSHQLSFRG